MAHQHKGSPVCISPWLSETVSILGAHTQHPASLALISGGAQQAATPAGGAQPQPPVQPGTVPPAAPPPLTMPTLPTPPWLEAPHLVSAINGYLEAIQAPLLPGTPMPQMPLAWNHVVPPGEERFGSRAPPGCPVGLEGRAPRIGLLVHLVHSHVLQLNASPTSFLSLSSPPPLSRAVR